MSQNLSPEEIRSLFSAAMSKMYRDEVPLYQQLCQLVTSINKNVLQTEPNNARHEIHDLGMERHGAIRIGKASELFNLRRLFAVMGMYPVDYYDLSVAGIPVHSTAFRPLDATSLNDNPFRIFTSLLRLESITNKDLRKKVETILDNREIMSQPLLDLIDWAEQSDGLNKKDSNEFIKHALDTFRWHESATVSSETYDQLKAVHPLLADIVSFTGPHINHLTPTTLDIDAVQNEMMQKEFKAKERIEGPPKRECPILLRQTSFRALDEKVIFKEGKTGTHTARFGEIEQRGVALTPKGRALYDTLLAQVRNKAGERVKENSSNYYDNLAQVFSAFPDSHKELRRQGLAFYQFKLVEKAKKNQRITDQDELEALIKNGIVQFIPIQYEDFLPVSAAGIFESNLDTRERRQQALAMNSSQQEFEEALGCAVIDSMSLYQNCQEESLEQLQQELNQY